MVVAMGRAKILKRGCEKKRTVSRRDEGRGVSRGWWWQEER